MPDPSGVPIRMPGLRDRVKAVAPWWFSMLQNYSPGSRGEP